jgi:hypothetical protein
VINPKALPSSYIDVTSWCSHTSSPTIVDGSRSSDGAGTGILELPSTFTASTGSVDTDPASTRRHAQNAEVRSA